MRNIMNNCSDWLRQSLTLSGGLSSSPCQGHHTFVHLRSVNGDAMSNMSQSTPAVQKEINSRYLEVHSICYGTLTPIRMPRSLIILTKDTPLSECWYNVSWKKMTPPRQLLIRSSAVKRICRNCRRFSSVLSTPTWARRFPMLPATSTSIKVIVLTVYLMLDSLSRCPNREGVTDPQTHPQPGCPSLERRCAGQSRGGPSSEPQTAPRTDASS